VAYVQLKPGADAAAEELLTFARDHVGERAAVPKAIRIVTAMPLTGVGKIFKPALKLRETEDALSEALRSSGVAFETLKASNDATQGTVVDVVLADGEQPQRAHRVLGQFSFRYRLEAPLP
jgi:fatty-acyl-CoA synthase